MKSQFADGVAERAQPPFHFCRLSEIRSNIPPNQAETIWNNQAPSEFFDHIATGLALDKASRKRKPLPGGNSVHHVE